VVGSESVTMSRPKSCGARKTRIKNDRTKKTQLNTVSTTRILQVDKLYINGIEQIEGVDYTVDQARGVINLIDVRKDSKNNA